MNPEVMWSPWNWRVWCASNSEVREGFFRTLSMADLSSVLKRLKRSSKRRARSWPALREYQTTYTK